LNNPSPDRTPLLGIIGGMGTQATACFYEKLHALQKVTVEQDYINILLYSKPSVPDRTAFITGQSTESPLDSLISAARILESAGASCIAIPCVTSHYFYSDLSSSVCIPVINLLEETALAASERNVRKVCLLATNGTIKGKVFDSAFKKYNIEICTVTDDAQSCLMELIYNIKCGVPSANDLPEPVKEQAYNAGAEALVLGCTELCIALDGSSKVINTLDVLAEAALKRLS